MHHRSIFPLLGSWSLGWHGSVLGRLGGALRWLPGFLGWLWSDKSEPSTHTLVCSCGLEVDLVSTDVSVRREVFRPLCSSVLLSFCQSLLLSCVWLPLPGQVFAALSVDRANLIDCTIAHRTVKSCKEVGYEAPPIMGMDVCELAPLRERLVEFYSFGCELGTPGRGSGGIWEGVLIERLRVAPSGDPGS